MYFAAFVACEILLIGGGSIAQVANLQNAIFWAITFLLRPSWRVLAFYGLNVMSYPMALIVYPDLDWVQQAVLMEQFGYVALGIIGFALFEHVFLGKSKRTLKRNVSKVLISSNRINKAVLLASMLLVLSTIFVGGLFGLFSLGEQRVVLPLRLDIPMILLVNYSFYALFFFFLLRVGFSTDLQYSSRVALYLLMFLMVVAIVVVRESKGFLISVFILIVVSNMQLRIFPRLRWQRIILFVPALFLVYGIATFTRQGLSIEAALDLLFSGSSELYSFLAVSFYDRAFGSAGDVLRLIEMRPDVYDTGAFAEVLQVGGAPRFNTEEIVAINTEKAYSAGTAGLVDVIFYFGRTAPMYFVFVQMLAPLVIGRIVATFFQIDRMILATFLSYWWIIFILFGGLTNLLFPLFLFSQIAPIIMFRTLRIRKVPFDSKSKYAEKIGNA